MGKTCGKRGDTFNWGHFELFWIKTFTTGEFKRDNDFAEIKIF